MQAAPGQSGNRGKPLAQMRLERLQPRHPGRPGASRPDRLSEVEEGDCGGLLFVERSWTAVERTVPKIKSQEAVRIPRNADPNALPDLAGFAVTASEP